REALSVFQQASTQVSGFAGCQRLIGDFGSIKRDVRVLLSALQHRNGSAEQQTEGDRDQNLLRVRRKNQNEPFSFHQRGKTRNAKRHHEQADDLPGFKFHFVFAGGGGADKKRETDDQAQSE